MKHLLPCFVLYETGQKFGYAKWSPLLCTLIPHAGKKLSRIPFKKGSCSSWSFGREGQFLLVKSCSFHFQELFKWRTCPLTLRSLFGWVEGREQRGADVTGGWGIRESKGKTIFCCLQQYSGPLLLWCRLGRKKPQNQHLQQKDG